MMRTSTSNRPRALLALAAALVCTLGASPQDPPTGSWSMEVGADGFSSGAAAASGSHLYVVGGLQLGSVSTFPEMFQQLRRYDPANDTWATLAPLPMPVSDNAAALVDGVLYSLGGSDVLNGGSTGAIQAYTVATDSWVVLDTTITPRQSHAAAALNGRIYVTGGYDGTDIVATAEEFDPAGGVTLLDDMPAALEFHAMAADATRVYAVGGFDPLAGPVAGAYAFDPANGTWSTLAPLQDASGEQPRYGAAAFSLQGRIYVTGGFYDDAMSATWEYNPADNSWARRADMNNARYFHGAAAIGDRGYVYGGAGVATGEEFAPPAFEAPSNHAPQADAGADQTVEATGADGATVTLDASGSSDPDGDDLTYSWSPVNASGANPTVALPIGENTITLSVSDGQETSTDTVVILVVDSEPPSMSGLSATPNVLWSPNHDMRAIQLSVSASDAGDSAPESEVVSVSSNQPTGDEEDWEITGAMTVNVRAERTGGESRVYTITVRCTDASGNCSFATTTVCVPHNQGNDGGAAAKKANK